MNDELWKDIFDSIAGRKDEGSACIQFLLKAGLDVNSRDTKDGCTMLSWAAQCGNLEMVEFLVQQGADGNVKNTGGSTPLHAAAAHGHKDIVQLFLNTGICVDSCDDDKYTPLHYVAFGRSSSPSSRTDYQELVHILVDNNADLNARTSHGDTPLFLAASSSSKDIVQLLVESGADVEYKGFGDQTLLHHASRAGWLDIVKCLVSRGFDLDAKDSYGDTPLLCACYPYFNAVMDFLVESGADVDCCDQHGWTVLHFACRAGWLDVVKTFIEKGADVNAQNDYCATPLHKAVEECHFDIVEHLLKAGADFNVSDSNGKTAFSLFIQNTLDLDGIMLFIENGAYFQPDDYAAISGNPLLKERVLQDTRLCTQSIANKFNNAHLPKVYEIAVVADKLPPIEKLKIASRNQVVREIAQSVGHEIRTKGYCNVLDVRPVALISLCVRSLVNFYDHQAL